MLHLYYLIVVINYYKELHANSTYIFNHYPVPCTHCLRRRRRGGNGDGAPNLAGVVTTLAGGGIALAYLDGTGTAAQFARPRGITPNGTSLYVADTGNNRIRQIQLP